MNIKATFNDMFVIALTRFCIAYARSRPPQKGVDEHDEAFQVRLEMDRNMRGVIKAIAPKIEATVQKYKSWLLSDITDERVPIVRVQDGFVWVHRSPDGDTPLSEYHEMTQDDADFIVNRMFPLLLR